MCVCVCARVLSHAQDGKTALDHAKEQGSQDVVRLIEVRLPNTRLYLPHCNCMNSSFSPIIQCFGVLHAWQFSMRHIQSLLCFPIAFIKAVSFRIPGFRPGAWLHSRTCTHLRRRRRRSVSHRESARAPNADRFAAHTSDDSWPLGGAPPDGGWPMRLSAVLQCVQPSVSLPVSET